MAVPPPSPPDKPALRRALREARRAFVAGLDPDRLAACRMAIHDRLRPLLDRTGPIAGYVATGDEPDVMAPLGDAARAGRQVALPHVSAGRAMSFAAWRPDVALVRGALGIAQPAAAGSIVPAILLVPLLGFDRSGARLGQGGGYYDRWCAAHPRSFRVGIAWSVQEVSTLPVDGWDVPLHGIVTERERIDL